MDGQQATAWLTGRRDFERDGPPALVGLEAFEC
jgi:hypothetical protein